MTQPTGNATVILNSTPPTHGEYRRGTICINDGAVPVPVGWVCTVTGFPGTWIPLGAGYQNLLKIGTPMAIAPTGTMADNGGITLGTSLVNTYSGGIWLYLSANAIAASGYPAGFYWTVMSSGTAGTVYGNTYTPGTNLPTPPTTLIPLTTTGPGAFTGVTSEVTYISTTVPGGILGTDGELDVVGNHYITSSANAKTLQVKYAGTALLSSSVNTTTGLRFRVRMQNAGSTGRQASWVNNNAIALSEASSASPTVTLTALDTTTDQTLAVTVTRATATEISVLFGFRAEVSL